MITIALPLDLDVIGIGSSTGNRAPGLHASTIYNDLYQDLEPERYVSDRTPPPLLLEIGLILETSLEEGLKRRMAAAPGESIERPGEFTYASEFEGVPFECHYNPDLFIFNGEFRIGEIKATKMSPTIEGYKAPETAEIIKAFYRGDQAAAQLVATIPFAKKFDKYWTQIKLYCFFQRTLFGRLYAFFINGTYKPDLDPVFLAWDVTFEMDELENNYSRCLYHALHKGMI